MVEGHKVILAGGFVTEDGQVKSGSKTKTIERSKTQNKAANKEAARLEQYQSNLIQRYIQKYQSLVNETKIGYKKAAINSFLTEYYCSSNNDRYLGRHRELTEKALFGDKEWYKLRKSLQQTENEQISELLDNKMPFSMRKAAMLMHEAVMKNLDIDELDRRRIKKPEQTETESEDENETKQKNE